MHPDRPHVLHVTESLGGGVMVAINSFIESSQAEFTHEVLGRLDPGSDAAVLESVPMSALPSKRQPIRCVRAIRSHVIKSRADVVHLHSSWAGLYGRLLAPTVPVVYSPHCFGFEKRDVSEFHRRIYRFTEFGLSRHTTGFIAVSEHEAGLAAKLSRGRPVTFVNNISGSATGHQSVTNQTKESGNDPLFVAGGRLAAQKGYDWFLGFAREVRDQIPDAQFAWLGGGAPDTEAVLRAAGVRVTGWLPQQALLTELATADVYVHTAAWEGAPLLLLEAAAFALPVVARQIPALSELCLPYTASSPAQAAKYAVLLWASADARAAAAHESMRITKTYSRERQTERLLAAYRSALGGGLHKARLGALGRTTHWDKRRDA